MERDKMIGIALAVINIILLVFCTVRYIQSDRTPPRFLLEATDIIYTPGMEDAELAQGITANDDRDGDVTGRIVVEKITEKKKEQTAVVYYAVCDKAGNVTKLSKLFHAEYPEEEKQALQDINGLQGGGAGRADIGDSPGQEPDSQPSGNDIGTDNGNIYKEETNNDEINDDEINGDETNDEEISNDEINNDEIDDGETGNPDADRADQTGGETGEPEAAEPGEEHVQAEEPEDTAQPEPQGAVPVGSGAPELVLGSSEITINAGTNPPWTEIITTMRDDKDDYATLYYSLHVSQFNRNRPGTYPVTVYVEDSDGNRSQEVPFTIIVR